MPGTVIKFSFCPFTKKYVVYFTLHYYVVAFLLTCNGLGHLPT